MSPRSPRSSVEPARVGVRELRQNLSIYLDRVKAGERLEVTEHGLPVARLVPLPPATDPLARLLAEGKLRPAQGDLGDYLRSHPSSATPGGRTLTEVLVAQRDEEAF